MVKSMTPSVVRSQPVANYFRLMFVYLIGNPTYFGQRQKPKGTLLGFSLHDEYFHDVKGGSYHTVIPRC